MLFFFLLNMPSFKMKRKTQPLAKPCRLLPSRNKQSRCPVTVPNLRCERVKIWEGEGKASPAPVGEHTGSKGHLPMRS